MRRLAQYCINVADLDRSEKFYTEVLGLSVDQRIEIPGAKEIILVGDEGDTRMQLAQQLDNLIQELREPQEWQDLSEDENEDADPLNEWGD